MKNRAAVALAKLRAQKLTPAERSAIGVLGGTARAEHLTPERRSEIARKAGKAGAAKRWGKERPNIRKQPVAGTLDGVAPERWDEI